jgi:hypothetical protein
MRLLSKVEAERSGELGYPCKIKVDSLTCESGLIINIAYYQRRRYSLP